MTQTFCTRIWVCLSLLCLLAHRLEARSFSTVVIDAGHGGYDPGGIPGQQVQEKTVALDVARRLNVDLQKAGYQTVMTRSSDVFVPLPVRVAIANSQHDAIFICVHFNSANRSGANGIETYYYSPVSAGLAASIHANVAGGAPSENRGVRRRGYYVLRRNALPAVLVECGFLTNPAEARMAQTSSYRQQLADEITRGIRGQSALVTAKPVPAVTASAPAESPAHSRVDRHGTRYLDIATAAEAETSAQRAVHKSHTRRASHARKTTRHRAPAAPHKSAAKKSSSKKKPR